MRNVRWSMAASGLAVFGALGWAMGCATSPTDDLTDPIYARATGSGGSTSSSSTMSTTTTASGMMTSSSTGMDPGCVGEIKEGLSEDDTKRLISDKCGVFVQADTMSTGDDGTRANPFKSLQKAIAESKGRNVYVCTSAPFVEAVTISAAVSVYGGFDCKAEWKYSKSTRSNVEAPEDAIAVTILSKDVRLSNLGITANKAKSPGVSAIAVLARAAGVDFEGCVIEAGAGVAGANGASGGAGSASGGIKGEDGSNACSDLVAPVGPDANLPGGVGPTLMCGGDSSVGGDGGSGKPTIGTAGIAGTTGPLGAPGAGEPTAGTWGCGNPTLNGTGAGGDGGAEGDSGGAGKGKGVLHAGGYMGEKGGDGTAGKPGQGGGGGGGAKGGLICSGLSGAGASGGSGGSGGCGGGAGKGGLAGGSSIAIASFNSVVTLTDCSLKSGKGGDGGKGGDLQAGGSGGNPGNGGTGIAGSKDACPGGKGGQGGNGGPGGGGQGGHSLTIAYVGDQVTKIGTVELSPGASGKGGSGGSANVKGNAGDNGISMQELLFP